MEDIDIFLYGFIVGGIVVLVITVSQDHYIDVSYEKYVDELDRVKVACEKANSAPESLDAYSVVCKNGARMEY